MGGREAFSVIDYAESRPRGWETSDLPYRMRIEEYSAMSNIQSNPSDEGGSLLTREAEFPAGCWSLHRRSRTPRSDAGRSSPVHLLPASLPHPSRSPNLELRCAQLKRFGEGRPWMYLDTCLRSPRRGKAEG